VLPVEVELRERRASFEGPGSNPRRPLRQARFVDEN
jgi:hypothetical protein